MTFAIIDKPTEIAGWRVFFFLRRMRHQCRKVRVATFTPLVPGHKPEHAEFVGRVIRHSLKGIEILVETHWEKGAWHDEVDRVIAPWDVIEWASEEKPVAPVLPLYDGMADWERNVA